MTEDIFDQMWILDFGFRIEKKESKGNIGKD